MNTLRMLAELGNQDLSRNVSGLHCVSLPQCVQILRVYLSRRDHRKRES